MNSHSPSEQLLKSSGGDWRDEYAIHNALGEGGAAQVYRARRVSDGLPVALKVLRSELAFDDEERERLRREVLAIRSIDSPNVCSIHAFNVDAVEPYIVMDFVEGVTLRDFMADTHFTPKTMALIVGQVAEALHASHCHRIVHRDLKPENIMLTGPEDARIVKVLDFGMAKLLEHERRDEVEELTRAGVTFGTPQYISPEQVRGVELDNRADLFALGVVAYEMVAGRRPFRGDDAVQVMMNVATKEHPRLSALEGELRGQEEALNRFFDSALAKDPATRPQSAREFFIAFEVALGLREALGAPPQSFFEQLTVTGIDDLVGEPVDEDSVDRALTRRLVSSRLACLPLRPRANTDDEPTMIDGLVVPNLEALEDDEEEESTIDLAKVEVSAAPPGDLFPTLPKVDAQDSAFAGKTLNVRPLQLNLDKPPSAQKLRWLLLGILAGIAMSTVAVFLARM